MKVDDFRKMYIAELQELRSTEEQLTQALPKMIEMAQNQELKQAIQTHLDETRSQRDRLDEVLERHSASPREHEDASMQAIIQEADRWSKIVRDAELRDAGLIASAQRIEHYEIAVYGTVATWAKQLGFDEDLRTLLAILEEEKQTDDKLTDLAKRVINLAAAQD